MLEHLALSDNGFLFDTRSGYTYSLSRTGTYILRALMEGAPPESLADRVEGHFDVDRATAARDVEQFLFRLRDLDLMPGDDDEDDA